MRTGSIAITTAIYRSDCPCQFYARIPRGEEAPDCPLCQQQVGWEYVRPDYAPTPVNQSLPDTPRSAL